MFDTRENLMKTKFYKQQEKLFLDIFNDYDPIKD